MAFYDRKVPARMARTLDIGVDLDGVCYDFAGSLRTWLHKRKGRPLDSMPPTKTWHFYSEQWGMSLEEFIAACDESVDDGYLFSIGETFPHAILSVQHLMRMGHRIHIITDRSFGTDDRSQVNTKAWLSRHRVPYTSLTFSADKTIVPTDIFIDDRDKNYLELDAAGHNPFLMTRPWNSHLEGARRVKSWPEFMQVVRALSEGEVAA